MAHNYDKIVKLACKPKNAPPKAKYIDSLISATYSDDGSLNDISRSLAQRVRDPNPVVVFKALLTLHQMIRTGSTESLLAVLSRSDILGLRAITVRPTSGYFPPASAGVYAQYLDMRIRAFGELKRDLVRVQAESNRRSDGLGASSKARRLRHLPVDKGLLREVKQVQKILDSLLKCKFYDDDLRDENTVLAFRLIVKDLLVLFQAGNEGVCNILEHYFEMSKPDAQESFSIYKYFISQTDRTVDYLSVARKLHHVVNVPVPNLKHAPTSLVKALEEYLNDPNFEQNRVEYRNSLGVVEGRGGASPGTGTGAGTGTSSVSQATMEKPETKVTNDQPKAQPPPGSSQKVQDFFESIQADQQPTMFGGAPQQMNYAQMTVNQPQFNPFRQSMMFPQQTGNVNANANGFMQPQMTGFPHQAQPAPFLQPQQTGMMAFGGGGNMGSMGRMSMFPQMTGQHGNSTTGGIDFSQPPSQTPNAAPTQQSGYVQQSSFLSPQPQNYIVPQSTGFLQPQATGSNPFRQSTMFNPGGGSQPSSPFGPRTSAPQGQGQGQIQRPGSTPAFLTSSYSANSLSSGDAKPLVAQQTGSKNPFAPAPGSTPPVPTQGAQAQTKGPTMNDLLMGFAPNSVGQQQQQQAHGGQGQGIQAQQTGMTNVASSFVKPSQTGSGANPGGTDFLSQFSSFSNPTSPQPSTSSSNPLSFGSSQATGTPGAGGGDSGAFLQPQPTGYGGSAIKPFKPASSFGSQLLESLPPIAEPKSNPASPGPGPAGASAGFAPSPLGAQRTGYPFSQTQTQGQNQNQMGQMGQTQLGGQLTGGQGLTPQMTGANPFRQSVMPQSTGMGMSGMPGAFGGGAFGSLGQQGQGQGMGQQAGQVQGQGQFGMFGQQQQRQGGSLI